MSVVSLLASSYARQTSREMGSSGTKCSELLEQMGWEAPEYADEYRHSGLVSYLETQNLEVVLPKHAPQADLSIADRKPAMYPRPGYIWEAYKMHLAIIGPSTTCKNQMEAFLPRLASCFKGSSCKIAPGRNAIPYYFFDESLHKCVIWELPEITYHQKPDDYIREIGLMYIDCAFMLFSEKYPLSDIYCKIVVEMAVQGIPFFTICTDGDVGDEEREKRLKSYFQKKDVSGIRMLNPDNPGKLLSELINDFFKEISWNRSCVDKELTKLSDNILGQTIRIKNLEKKPELNGRCGVCIGFDRDKDRYRVRIITNGVENDLNLKQECLSVLKPKLLNSMVRIDGLESKPELNGRYGYVDAFLRENERYRVLIPEQPGLGTALALKSANLVKVDRPNAEPLPALKAPEQRAVAPPPKTQATYGPFVAECKGGMVWEVVGGGSKSGLVVRRGSSREAAAEAERLAVHSLVEELLIDGDRLNYKLLYGTGPPTGWVSLSSGGKALLVQSDAVVSGSRTARQKPASSPYLPKAESSTAQSTSGAGSPVSFAPSTSARDQGRPSARDMPAAARSAVSSSTSPTLDRPAQTDKSSRRGQADDDDLSRFLPGRQAASESGGSKPSRPPQQRTQNDAGSTMGHRNTKTIDVEEADDDNFSRLLPNRQSERQVGGSQSSRTQRRMDDEDGGGGFLGFLGRGDTEEEPVGIDFGAILAEEARAAASAPAPTERPALATRAAQAPRAAPTVAADERPKRTGTGATNSIEGSCTKLPGW